MEVDTLSDDSILGGTRKLLCQRGRKIVSDLQAKMYMNGTLDSTSSTITNELQYQANVSSLSSDTLSESFVVSTDRPHTQEERRRFILENNKKWAQAEEVHGGPYNHFRERREFRPQFANDCDDDVGSENVAPNDVVDPASDRDLPIEDNASPGPSSSQGRFGQGCSTPQRINNTLAPLRQWEVSAVISLDQTVDKDNALREVASGVLGKNPPIKPATFIKPSAKVISGLVPPTFKADDSMSDVIASLSTKSKQEKSTEDGVSIAQPSVSLENSNINAASTFVYSNSVQNSAVDSPNDGTFLVQNNATFDVKKVSDKTDPESSGSTASTFVVPNTVYDSAVDSPKDGTFLVQNNETFEVIKVSNEPLDPESSGSAASAFVVPNTVNSGAVDSPNDGTFSVQNNDTLENKINSAESVAPNNTSTAKPIAKVKLEDRNNRALKAVQMASHHSNQSMPILADISVGMDSPGSVVFATRPSKKYCNAVTPSHLRMKNRDNDVEHIINMSEVSQGGSIMDVDDSMVDPVTDPRSIIDAPTTPTRSLQHRPRSLLKNHETIVEDRAHTPARPNTPARSRGYMEPTMASLNRARMSAGRCSLGRNFYNSFQDCDSPMLTIDPSRLIAQNITSGARPRVTNFRKNSNLTRNFYPEINNIRRETMNNREKADVSSTFNTASNVCASPLGRPKELRLSRSDQPEFDDVVDRQLLLSTGSLNLNDSEREVMGHADVPEIPVFDDFDAYDLPAQESMRVPLSEPVQIQQRRNLMLLDNSIYSQSSPQAEVRSSNYHAAIDESLLEITASQSYGSSPKSADEYVLKPNKLIQPERSVDGLRRSKRVRTAPCKYYLGQMPVYKTSPSGNKTLVGSSKVIIDGKTARRMNLDKNVTDARHKQNVARRAKELNEMRKMESRRNNRAEGRRRVEIEDDSDE